MVIDAAELAKRQRYIGASDVGIILGLSPWKTQVDLWTDKVYGAKFMGNAATKRGNMWEPLVIEHAEDYLQKEIAVDVRFERHYELDGHVVKFAANTDGVVLESKTDGPCNGDDLMFGTWVPEAVVEAKTARDISHWGMPGTDEIPDTYLVQTYCQMWCSGAQRAWVPVLCGFDFFMYQVERPEEHLLNDVIHSCAKWWVEFVVPKKRPEGPPPKVSVLSTIERIEGEVVELDRELGTIVEEWLAAVEARKAAAITEDETKRRLIEALGEAEVGLLPGGFLSYFANRAGARTLKWNEEKWTEGMGN